MTAGVLAGLKAAEPVLISLASAVSEVPALASVVVIEPAGELSLAGPSVQGLLTHRETPSLDTGFLALTLLQEPALNIASTAISLFYLLEPVRVSKAASIAE